MFPVGVQPLMKNTRSNCAPVAHGSHARAPKIGTSETAASYRSPSATSSFNKTFATKRPKKHKRFSPVCRVFCAFCASLWLKTLHDSQRPDLHDTSSVYNWWR